MANAPDVQYLDGLIAEGRARFQEFHAQCDEIEDLFHRRHAIYIPDAYKTYTQPIKTPAIEDIVRRGVALLTEGFPTASQIPVVPGPDAQERANKVEAWLNAAFKQLERQTGRTVFRNVVEDAIKFGVGWLWCEYTPDAWDEYDTAVDEKAAKVRGDSGRMRAETKPEREHRLDILKRRQPLPWHLTDVDPRSVYVFKDGRGIREALIGVERPRFQIADKYGVGIVRNRLSDAPEARRSLGEGMPADHTRQSTTNWGTTTFWTHYDREYVSYYADRQLLQQRKHGYKRPPLFECRGLSTSSRDPALSYRSLVAPITHLVKSLDSLLTIFHNWAVLTGFAMLQEIPRTDAAGLPFGDGLDVDTDGKPAQPVKWEPGKAFRGTGEWRFIVPPSVGPAVREMITIHLQQIESVTPMPPVLKGLSPGADTPGYSLNQMRQEARMVHQIILANIGTGYEDLAEFLLWGVDERIGEPVYVAGLDPRDERKKLRSYLGLAPSDVKGYYQINISINADAPMQDVAMLRAGIEAWQAGYLPHEYSLEHFAKIANPQPILDAIEVEKVAKLPQVAEEVARQAMQRAGFTPVIEAAAQNADQGLMGQGDVPVDAGYPNGPGLPAGLPPPPEGAPPIGPTMGGLAGVPQQPNTAMQPDGQPVGV